jgi:Fic family protein
MAKGPGATKQPGEFRTSQNWIGGSRPGNAVYVPPPHASMMQCLDAFEEFLHDQPERLSVLVTAALAHVQFELIHPFLDGNGRVGRLLVALLLCAEGALSEPLLYLSLYFKNRRSDYYRLLQRVQSEGDWEVWLDFFLVGVREMADQCARTARQIDELFAADRERIMTLGKAAKSCLRVHEAFVRKPLVSLRTIISETGLTFPTATKALTHLARLGIVKEIEKRARVRWFNYAPYIRALDEGTAPLKPRISNPKTPRGGVSQ